MSNTPLHGSRPLLAIDTSTQWLSLALRHGGHTRLFHQETGSRQSELILPQIAALLDEAGLAVADLAAIAYAQGPGAFTGLRIGAGVAQGLAAPFGIPLIPIPCLDAVASLCPGQAAVLAATDARMGEVFYAWFDTQTGQRLSSYRVGKAADIRLPEKNKPGQNTDTHFSGSLKHTGIIGIGNAFALPEPPPFPGRPDMPTAKHYLALAASGRYPAVSAAEAELLYVRNKVALTAAEQAARKGAA
ncbi:tRNA (adenosine(37)-N6)-threonylcarbamoyltransferase complex dimerization subunit type 1 TsaB [Eikenella sp. S3360]|uniref:tRNA (Adenosine(37)-N6)-threonylcarbamoyltransferase complex dimerization subunit type 1 TsaB n=1 Tax=Eikenella glucosivorans TaxID=2766967 RepID=A0ABS0NCT1_9NEIS|nr:tRNA (adenosine(37)-N6)-threonylcarbamoyltransferase complex dimerization subunit type 1 TsaB [Eikenella glucosivorans]MBH5330126.1 tRNA (adenosine(37)-N6)-threonylcarbamoyltransferase complex dimerization subunit type 1 TsaB [Eikenella glucosivorans]